MQDNLKTHISNSREVFEIHELDLEKGWQELEPHLKPARPTISRWFYIGGIAATLLLGWVGLSFYKQKSMELPAAAREWMEAEGFYQQEIDDRWHLVKGKVKDEQLLADLELMDEVLIELKTDLRENIDNEEVITAMMKSYRLKLKILDRILEQIEEQKYHETDSTLHM